jgi:V8-like Glu-specific endopeptidase
LITLKPPGVILNKFEYIKLEEEQERDTCIIVGYQEIHNYQTGANGPANKKTNGLYEYEMDTGKGQSGGPLLLSGTVQPIAIGVHIHGLIEKIKLRHTHYSKFYKMGMG